MPGNARNQRRRDATRRRAVRAGDSLSRGGRCSQGAGSPSAGVTQSVALFARLRRSTAARALGPRGSRPPLVVSRGRQRRALEEAIRVCRGEIEAATARPRKRLSPATTLDWCRGHGQPERAVYHSAPSRRLRDSATLPSRRPLNGWGVRVLRGPLERRLELYEKGRSPARDRDPVNARRNLQHRGDPDRPGHLSRPNSSCGSPPGLEAARGVLALTWGRARSPRSHRDRARRAAEASSKSERPSSRGRAHEIGEKDAGSRNPSSSGDPQCAGPGK